VSVAERLSELGIELPTPSTAGVYRPAVRSGAQIYVAGQLATRDGMIVHPGHLGKELSVVEGFEAARFCAINALGALQDLLGSLEELRLIRAVGYVASTPEFSEHPAVVNGASELLRDVFGEERGMGARVAFGVASLPMRSPVELELLMETY
jgi:enamine deaminase RidA (YjgF/YER057c/UK114 family)